MIHINKCYTGRVKQESSDTNKKIQNLKKPTKLGKDRKKKRLNITEKNIELLYKDIYVKLTNK